MTTNYVIDASVLVKLLLEEEYSEQAHRLLRQLEEDESIEWLAPDLVYAETANALWKRVRKQELTVQDAQSMMDALVGEILVRLVPSVALLDEAFRIANKLRHNAIYDCLYLALAVVEEARFVTADKVFYDKAGKHRMKKYLQFIGDVK